MLTIAAILIGFGLDLILGDPVRFPHPIVWMGTVISWYERKVRPHFKEDTSSQVLAGGILAIGLPIVSCVLGVLPLILCYLINPVLYVVVQSFMCYQVFSARELWNQSMAVGTALDNGVDAGRQAVGRIVGRDVAALDTEGVTKAAVETVAENTADGVVAPLIYMAIGGAPLGLFYKAVNTLDSMIGYKNDNYLHFGRIAARFDDVLNYLPARFAALCIVVTAPFVRLSSRGAWQMWQRDRRNHASPNSAQTEAAFAGAMGIQLAGNAIYFGKTLEKPTIGEALRPIAKGDILQANTLMMATSIFALVVCSSVRAAVFVILG